MFLRLLFLACLIVAVAALPAAAGGSINPTKVVATPIPISGGFAGPSFAGGAHTGPACLLSYDDLLPTGTSFLALDSTAPAGGPYTEYADDCHLLAGGALCEVKFTYFQPTPGPFSMIITVYENDASNSVLGAAVAGPYLLTALPAGLVTLTVPLPSPLIPADVWFSITGTSTFTHGLVIAGGPPTVGSSDDVFLHVPSLGLVFFGGSPLANFNISMLVDATVPVEESTWGVIKSLYQE